MRRTLSFYRPVETGTNAYNEPEVNWLLVGTVPGQLEPLQGRELQIAQQTRADVTHRGVIRWMGDLNPKWIVRDEGGIEYQIASVTHGDGRRIETRFDAVQGLA